MEYLKIEVDVPEFWSEAATAVLIDECGGVEEPQLPEPVSGRHVLAGYLPSSERERAVGIMSRLLELPEARVRTSTVEEEDWANTWKAYYRPLTIGEKLLILPAWLSPDPDQAKGRQIVRLDPGMAFGTGEHASTYLALMAIEEFLRPGDRVLDVGTGSGILTIAAAKLGAGRIEAIDIDPVAVRVAGENLNENELTTSPAASTPIVLRQGEIESVASESANLVVANITADVILSIAGDLLRVLEAGRARLLLSGLTASGEGDFREQFEPQAEKAGLALLSRKNREGWVALTYERS